MFVSYVLRVRPENLSKDRFVGEVEAVGTGQRYAVRSFDQVVAFVLETMRDEVDLTRDALAVQQEDL
jgi:hypothetical protein